RYGPGPGLRPCARSLVLPRLSSLAKMNARRNLRAHHHRQNGPAVKCHWSFCLKTFSHPDCTVGSGFSPDPPSRHAGALGRGLQPLAVTAGRELADRPPHPAPKVTYAIE